MVSAYLSVATCWCTSTMCITQSVESVFAGFFWIWHIRMLMNWIWSIYSWKFECFIFKCVCYMCFCELLMKYFCFFCNFFILIDDIRKSCITIFIASMFPTFFEKFNIPTLSVEEIYTKYSYKKINFLICEKTFCKFIFFKNNIL